MLDIAFIRDNPEAVKDAVEKKNAEVDIDQLIETDDKRRSLLREVEDLRQQRNEVSKRIQDTDDKQAAIDAAKEVKEQLSRLEPELESVEATYQDLLEAVPNIMADDTPIGDDETGNQVVSSWGDKPDFDFEVKDHMALGEALDIIDIPRARKVSGARFNFLKGDLALLQFALVNYVLQQVSDESVIEQLIESHGLNLVATPFTPVVPPMLVRPETMQRMARLEPKDDRFLTLDEEYVLVGSAEHALGAMHMDEVLEASQLPLRYVGYSSAFRREAGSYGKDTHGIIRQHQFDKLELETFSTADTGEDEHRLMLAIQEHIMQQLGLPYQVVRICSGDMGAPDYMQTDIETWMPGQGRYRETHTVDYMTDYQARRLKTRYKDSTGEIRYVHMNDGTAVAVGRMLIAIMENCQTNTGGILVPEVLRPYMDKEEIV